MSTNESTAGPGRPDLDGSPATRHATELDPSAQDPAADEKVRLQVAIFEVTRDAGGKSLDEIQALLRAAFARHAVETPPATWVESVASSAYYGEPYIIDLTVAVAADKVVPAPTEELRERLARRRELRNEKLPPGIFPARSDWELSPGEVTGGSTRTVSATRWETGAVLALAALAAVAVAAVVAIRAGTGRRASKASRTS